MNRIVIYKSKYGSSRQYAVWLADALKCKAESTGQIKQSDLLCCDVIVYVGGLYAGGVNGFKKISRHLEALKNKKLVLCMVGMTDPAEKNMYDKWFMQNVPEEYRSAVKYFALQGDQLFSEMSFIHRIMMNIPKKMIERVPEAERTEENRRFLESFGKDARFVEEENIREAVSYIEALQVI